jgi:hypothetical protein
VTFILVDTPEVICPCFLFIKIKPFKCKTKKIYLLNMKGGFIPDRKIEYGLLLFQQLENPLT